MMTDFAERLSAMCAEEAYQAQRDQERQAAMLEALAASLGHAVAAITLGNAEAANALLEGATAHAFAEAGAGMIRAKSWMRGSRP